MNENSTMWFLALMLLLFGGGFNGRGYGAPTPPNVATQEFVQETVNNQSTQGMLNQVLLSSANNNYETARLLDSQTNRLEQQNNTNLINAIQGFNQVNQNIQNQTNVLQGQLIQLGAKLDSCCCEIKTQMLQQQLDEANRRNVEKDNQISNYNQSQYILGQLGRFVAWAGSGAPATGASSGT